MPKESIYVRFMSNCPFYLKWFFFSARFLLQASFVQLIGVICFKYQAASGKIISLSTEREIRLMQSIKMDMRSARLMWLLQKLFPVCLQAQSHSAWLPVPLELLAMYKLLGRVFETAAGTHLFSGFKNRKKGPPSFSLRLTRVAKKFIIKMISPSLWLYFPSILCLENQQQGIIVKRKV